MLKKTIFICSQLAEEAYSEKLTYIPTSTLLVNTNTDCEVHVGILDEVLYVASRGTSSLEDAVHDMQIWRTKCKFLGGTSIHSGFLQQYVSIQCPLHEEIRKILDSHKVKSVVFTGHSLGGALSTIASLDFKLKNPNKVVKCITFASPRVGCKEFARLFNKTMNVSHRIVYHRDPVTFAPLCLRFRHVKGCIHFKKDKRVVHSDSYFFPFGCMISQHFMENYKKVIEEWNNEIIVY